MRMPQTLNRQTRVSFYFTMAKERDAMAEASWPSLSCLREPLEEIRTRRER